MKAHWYIGKNRTVCGMVVYPTDVRDEYDTRTNGRIEAFSLEAGGKKGLQEVTCKRCRLRMEVDL